MPCPCCHTHKLAPAVTEQRTSSTFSKIRGRQSMSLLGNFEFLKCSTRASLPCTLAYLTSQTCREGAGLDSAISKTTSSNHSITFFELKSFQRLALKALKHSMVAAASTKLTKA